MALVLRVGFAYISSHHCRETSWVQTPLSPGVFAPARGVPEGSSFILSELRFFEVEE